MTQLCGLVVWPWSIRPPHSKTGNLRTRYTHAELELEDEKREYFHLPTTPCVTEYETEDLEMVTPKKRGEQAVKCNWWAKKVVWIHPTRLLSPKHWIIADTLYTGHTLIYDHDWFPVSDVETEFYWHKLLIERLYSKTQGLFCSSWNKITSDCSDYTLLRHLWPLLENKYLCSLVKARGRCFLDDIV